LLPVHNKNSAKNRIT